MPNEPTVWAPVTEAIHSVSLGPQNLPTMKRAVFVTAVYILHSSSCNGFAPSCVGNHPTALASASSLCRASSTSACSTSLHAKKKPAKKKNNGGGGFGAAKSSSSVSTGSSRGVATISADKDALEKQWDCFASITDLEIRPVLDESDPNYRKFEVADVFVRVGSGGGGGDKSSASPAITGWYRVGKVVAADDIAIEASLSLHRGLIFWTAAHMWPELVAKGGKKGAQLLELGHATATMYMASDSDPPLEDEEGEEVKISERASSNLVEGVSSKDIGFRPDYNPPGFAYKRREKAAMKKKKSNMEEIMAVGDE